MDSARDAAAASDAVISPRLWATLREPLPGWPGFARSGSNLALAKRSRVLLPRASNLPTKRRNYWCKRRNSTGARCDKPHGCHGLWHGRRFASQQLERSSEEPTQQATTQETLVEASQLLLRFMYACVVLQAAQMPLSLARSTVCFPAVRAFIGGACATA